MKLHAKGESLKETTKALRGKQSGYFAKVLQSKLVYLFAEH